jgi:beta-glucuronidase
LIGEHEGGFTPFNFEVTDRVRTGSNLLVVRVDNERSAEDAPTETTDWLNYGGLTRDVRLLSLPETFVRSYRVALDPEREGHVHGWVQLDGPARPTPVRVAIPELDSRVDVVTDDRGRAGFQLDAVPERWSPGSPRLYRVEIEAGDDRVVEEVGFRTVEVQGDEILLNGEPVFLRGISLHEEAPGAGRASGDADAATLLGWARDLSCNFVRLAHYPHDEATSRLADRMGLLVWAEIPVYWDVAFGSEAALERARRQLSELIERDANRASVILWSIGNETPLGDERQRFMTALARYARSADSTRLVTAALLAGPDSLARFFGLYYLPATIGLRRDTWVYRAGDPLGEVVDVPALNQYFGWYYSGAFGLLGPVSSYRARRVMLDNLDRIRLDPGVPKPLIVSELGAGALAGFHAPEGELAAYSEEYQALVYRRQIAMLERQPSLRGVSPWVLKDFRSPLRLYQGVQDYWNRKGLVADDGTRKQAFYVLRDWYRELAERQGSS